MKVPGGASNDKGFDKYVPKTVTPEEVNVQERLTKEQLDEIEKWRSMSADERKKVVERLVHEIDCDAKQSESTSKECPSSGGVKVSSANSCPTVNQGSRPDASPPGSTSWIISEIIRMLVNLPPGELSNDMMGDLVTIHILLRSIQVRESASSAGGSTGTARTARSALTADDKDAPKGGPTGERTDGAGATGKNVTPMDRGSSTKK